MTLKDTAWPEVGRHAECVGIFLCSCTQLERAIVKSQSAVKISRVVSRLGAIALALLSARLIWVAFFISANPVLQLSIASLLLFWAYFLFRLRGRAQRSFACALVLIAIAAPVSAFNPFAAGDTMAEGGVPQTVPEILIWLIPLEIVFLGAAYFIDIGADAAIPKIVPDNQMGTRSMTAANPSQDRMQNTGSDNA